MWEASSSRLSLATSSNNTSPHCFACCSCWTVPSRNAYPSRSTSTSSAGGSAARAAVAAAAAAEETSKVRATRTARAPLRSLAPSAGRPKAAPAPAAAAGGPTTKRWLLARGATIASPCALPFASSGSGSGRQPCATPIAPSATPTTEEHATAPSCAGAPARRTCARDGGWGEETAACLQRVLVNGKASTWTGVPQSIWRPPAQGEGSP
mmetsp:Transcript_67079/g.218367  ORF Transcript_67079/g.218367 Transcript_67079/m.218367 type:complete len:209 (+) Transcript_67079:384-1010(+)